MSILTAEEAAGRATSWNKQTPTSLWLSKVTYGPGAIVHHNGGIWIEVNSLGCKNSEPISGNTDWTLVAGIPYADLTLGPSQYLFLSSNPVIAVPAPGVGVVAVPRIAFLSFTASTPPVAFSASFQPGLGYSAGSAPIATFVVTLDGLTDNEQFVDEGQIGSSFGAGNNLLNFGGGVGDARNQAITLGADQDGDPNGDGVLKVRTYYTLYAP